MVGILAAPQILILMGTPAEVLPNSVTYFRIYFAGSLAFVMYNFLVGILQSVGDSRHPLIYLMISSVINIVLDLILVAGFHFGVGAAALATVISQVISALLCLRQLLKSPADYHVVVQSNINKFGAMAVAGCGSYSKIEGFGFLPITCFALALTTFIGQNLGAKEYDRAKKGAVFGVVCSLSIAELVGIGIYLLSPYLIAGFNDTPQVISYGTAQAHTVTLFYFLLAFSHCMAGILRGAGKSAVPMFVMLICWCIIRVSYITIAVNFIHDIRVIFWAYPITWTLSSITFLIYFLKSDWLHAFEKRAA